MIPISTIAFDADDTLWHNENLFDEHHRKYCELLSEFHDADTVEKTLFETEMKNLELYGYGIKSFALSSIETAIALTEGAISPVELNRIIEFGKNMLAHPVELIDGVAEVVEELSKHFRLILITKGDLRDQERKIAQSGLAHCFEHTEVVSEKSVESYDRVLMRSAVDVSQFMMIGNSLKSDILPILDLGGRAVHIPYHLTWVHERVAKAPSENTNFCELESIKQLPELVRSITELA